MNLNLAFASLSDPTRRDILTRLIDSELTVGEIAVKYKLTFAAISKHLMVLERALLVIKHRRGKEQVVRIQPAALEDAAKYINAYEKLWQQRFDKIGQLVKEG